MNHDPKNCVVDLQGRLLTTLDCIKGIEKFTTVGPNEKNFCMDISVSLTPGPIKTIRCSYKTEVERTHKIGEITNNWRDCEVDEINL